MGLFGDDEDERSRDEVRVSMPENQRDDGLRTSSSEENGRGSKLESEVESKVKSGSSRSRGSSKRRSKSSSNRSSGRSSSRSSNSRSSNETRITGSTSSNSSVDLEDIHEQNEKIIQLLEQIADEGSSSSSRVTDKNQDEENSTAVGSGMNELL